METCLLAAGVVILVVSLGLASASDLSNRTIPNACVVSAALAAMPGVESQLNSHIAIGKHNGITDAQVAEILQKVDPKLTVHDFRMVRGSRHTNVIFDLVLPFSMEERKQELRELVERELQTDGKEYHAIITFDTQAFNAPDDPCDDPEKT